jgi:hypothetical protein
MEQDQLPSVIRDNQFDERGLVRGHGISLVPAYVASQWGFNSAGMERLYHFYSTLRERAGVLALCPFTACSERLDTARLGTLQTKEEVDSFWEEFNNIVGPINYGTLMPRSKFMIALLDGGHTIDDGVATEIGYYTGEFKGKKPIVGIRGDIRLAENPMAPINPAIRYFLDKGPYGGILKTGRDAYDRGLDAIIDLAYQIRTAPHKLSDAAFD